MDYQNPIVCTNYEEITALIPMITRWYQDGTFVHFIKQEHMNENCNLIQDSFKVIFIPADLEQAARIIINQYNEHFPPREDDEDDNDDEDYNDEEDYNDDEVDDNDDDVDNEVDPQIAFTCPACGVLTLGN